MAINKRPLHFSNPPQIRVKSFSTYAQLLLDKYPATFSMVLRDGKRSGFYVRTANNFYKVGSLQLQTNVVPLSSEGLSPEEAEQILVRWADITDRPVSTPAQIDEAIMNPHIATGSFIKVIVNSTPSEGTVLQTDRWYIVPGNTADDYSYKLPKGQQHLASIKISSSGGNVINVSPPSGETVNASTRPVSLTKGTVEFVFDANTNNWIVVR